MCNIIKDDINIKHEGVKTLSTFSVGYMEFKEQCSQEEWVEEGIQESFSLEFNTMNDALRKEYELTYYNCYLDFLACFIFDIGEVWVTLVVDSGAGVLLEIETKFKLPDDDIAKKLVSDKSREFILTHMFGRYKKNIGRNAFK